MYTAMVTVRRVGRKLLGRDERHATILRGAAAAFARGGYAGTSMDDVAAAVGVTRLIVYRHFDSKEDLYRAVLQQVFDRHAELFVAGVQAHDPRAVGAGSHLTVAREWPDGYVLLWRQAAHEPPFAEYADQLRTRAVDAARALLSSPDGDEVLERWGAQVVVGLIVEAVLAWLAAGDPARDDELLDKLTAGVLALRATWFT